MIHFPDDWIKPKEFTFCHCGFNLLKIGQKKCDSCGTISPRHTWISEVRDNIASIRQKYLRRLFWL